MRIKVEHSLMFHWNTFKGFISLILINTPFERYVEGTQIRPELFEPPGLSETVATASEVLCLSVYHVYV